MTLHQVHRLVQLALGAMAVGFAALAGTIGESATKKPLAGGQLGNAGTEVAFGRRKFGADEGLNHILYHTLYKIRMESKRKNAIRICPSLGSGLKHQWNQMIWSARELGCGIAEGSALCIRAQLGLRGGGRRRAPKRYWSQWSSNLSPIICGNRFASSLPAAPQANCANCTA